MSDNPYAPPSLPAETLGSQWPTDGIYRDGPWLIVHHREALPMICWKTGRAAERVRRLELPAQDADESISPVRRTFWLKKPMYRLEVPASNYQLWREALAVRITQGVCVILFLVLVLAMYAALYYFDRTPPHRTIMLGSLSLLVIAVATALLSAKTPGFVLQYVRCEFLWIAGAGETFLRSLPQWPVAKPPLWRQIFRWDPHAPLPPKKEEIASQKPD
jgi:hypothetical protein